MQQCTDVINFLKDERFRVLLDNDWSSAVTPQKENVPSHQFLYQSVGPSSTLAVCGLLPVVCVVGRGRRTAGLKGATCHVDLGFIGHICSPPRHWQSLSSPASHGDAILKGALSTCGRCSCGLNVFRVSNDSNLSFKRPFSSFEAI